MYRLLNSFTVKEIAWSAAVDKLRLSLSLSLQIFWMLRWVMFNVFVCTCESGSKEPLVGC
jgi:hypothetical protein